MLSLVEGNDRSFLFHRWLPLVLVAQVDHHVLVLLDGRDLLVVLVVLGRHVREHLAFHLGQEALVVPEAQEDRRWQGLVKAGPVHQEDLLVPSFLEDPVDPWDLEGLVDQALVAERQLLGDQVHPVVLYYLDVQEALEVQEDSPCRYLVPWVLHLAQRLFLAFRPFLGDRPYRAVHQVLAGQVVRVGRLGSHNMLLRCQIQLQSLRQLMYHIHPRQNMMQQLELGQQDAVYYQSFQNAADKLHV